MNPVWILLIVAMCVVVGIAGWLVAGMTILLRRSVYPKRLTPQHNAALAGASCTDVEFPSAGDGALLSGWFVPAQIMPIRGAVLCCHGMSQTRDQMVEWAASLWKAGFHVLLFDFRAVGKSEGDRATGGVLEAEDVLGALDYLTLRPDCAGLKVGALGFSMGGSAAIMAAAKDRRISAVATHAAYATLDSAIAARCRFHFGVFGPIVDWGFKQVGRKHFHVQPEDINPVRVVSCLAPRPLLVLHGKKDPIIPPHNAYELYEAAGEPKSLHFLEEGDHEPEHAHTEEVHAQVVAFFRQYLASDRSKEALPYPQITPMCADRGLSHSAKSDSATLSSGPGQTNF